MEVSMKVPILLAVAAMALPCASAIYAQSSPATSQYITREEFEKYKQDQDKKHQEEIRKIREESATAKPAPAAAAPAPAPVADNSDSEEAAKEIREIKSQVDSLRPGSSTLVIAGDADFGFTVPRHGSSNFDAGLAPLFLWRPYKDILFEGAFDVGISTDGDNNSSTSFDLTIANVSYLLCDNAAIGGGLFVVPFGVYHNHFDPPWINKFPDDPLAFSDGGIAPSSELGAYLRGAVPVKSTKVTYDLYVTNGPNLITKDPAAAGSLNFADYTDLNNNKAVGGRLGFLPLPNLEAGYSVQVARVNPSDFQKVNALLQAVDVNYRYDANWAGGVFDMRAEWVWSSVGQATYGVAGPTGFGPLNFENDRDGGYVQLCYRPTKADSKFIRNFELVSRYDTLNIPTNAPGGDRETRWTFGVDYWVTPSVVLKAAYELDDKKVGDSNNAFLFQVGIGL
jgi:hypothetical protein